MPVSLRDLQVNQKAVISSIKCSDSLLSRIQNMGIIPGTILKVIGRAPLNDPVALKVKGQTITLRNNEADHIFVEVLRHEEA